ncbi:MAG: hypothetical protein V1495_05315 [Pseudomonadota bacterium]
MFYRVFFLFPFLLTAFSACVSTDTVKSSKVDFDTINAKYTLFQTQDTGREVTVKLEFRVGGTTGTTVEFDEGEKFLVNGETIPFYLGGTSAINTEGSYYQRVIELDDATETLDITFMDKQAVEHKEVVSRARPVAFTSVSDGDAIDITKPLQITFAPAIEASGELDWRDTVDNKGNYQDHISTDTGSGTFDFSAQNITGKNVIAVFLKARVSKTSSVPPEGFVQGSVSSGYETKTLTLHLP